MKVLLVDDHPLVLSALQAVIQRIGSNTTVMGADSAAAARAALASDSDYDLVLLDLQAVSGDPAVLVTRCLALIEPQRAQTGRTARLVAFGPHVAKDRLDQAKAAGADASVSRGELLGGFPAIVRQWCG